MNRREFVALAMGGLAAFPLLRRLATALQARTPDRPESRILRVPEEFPSLMGALRQARDGDTIVISAGTHLVADGCTAQLNDLTFCIAPRPGALVQIGSAIVPTEERPHFLFSDEPCLAKLSQFRGPYPSFAERFARENL